MIMSPKEPPAKKQKTDATATEGLDVLQAAAEVGVGVTDASAIATAAAVASAVAETNVVPRRSDGKKYVGKGSLVEEELIRAKQEARSKNPEDMTADEKKEERRIANRLSAFQSRQRRKAIIEDLHKTVAKISKDNSEQRKITLELTTKLDAARSENALLRQQLAMISAGFGQQPTGEAPADGSAPAPAIDVMGFLNQLQQTMKAFQEQQAASQKTDETPAGDADPAAEEPSA